MRLFYWIAMLVLVSYSGSCGGGPGAPAGNRPPIAAVESNRSFGIGTQQVQLDGSGSSDPDGDSLSYAWDRLLDGVTDSQLSAYAFEAEPGEHVVKLTVTDPDGLSNSTLIAFEVFSGQFSGDAVANIGVGDSIETAVAALTDVKGRPGLAFRDLATNDLNFASAGSGGIITVAEGDLAEGCDLEVIGGKPAIAYSDGDFGARFVSAQDEDGQTWQTPSIIDANEDAGRGIQLEAVDGNPAVTYIDIDGDDTVYFSRALDANGSQWSPRTELGSVLTHLAPPVFAVINGRPAIAFRDPQDLLMFARASDAQGDNWPVAHDTSLPEPVGLGGLEDVQGSPIIVFSNNPSSADGGNVLISGSSSNGDSWIGVAEAEIGDNTEGPQCAFTSDGRETLHIFYLSDSGGVDKLVYRPFDLDLNPLSEPITVDNGVPFGLTAAMVGGAPGAAYYLGEEVKYALLN